MVQDNLLRIAIAAIECGYVPDSLARLAMRRLCGRRLAAIRGEPRLREEFLAAASEGPIAPVPEKANEQHYEVPAEFFRHVLGSHRKYSCCYWPAGVQTLDEAEEVSLRITCQRAGIEHGQTILELGCGWGALSLWIAEQYRDCRIVAVSNSASQRAFIEAEARHRGLDRHLRVITADMNDFDPAKKFDRVVSIEMFEHMLNHRELLKRISGWLNPAGRLFVHVFCHREFSYPFREKGAADWMSRHFFTGGVMPGEDLLPGYDQDLRPVERWRWDGHHYRKTADAWIARMDANRELIMPLLANVYGDGEPALWFQRWRMLFMAGSELFGYDDGNQWFVAHYLFAPTLPAERAGRAGRE